jgi:TonB family protein
MFSSLELKRPRKGAFWISVGFHMVLLSAGLLIPLWLTDTLTVDPFDWVLIIPPPQPKDVLEVTPYRLPPVDRTPEKLVAPPPRIPTVVQETLRRPEPEELAAADIPETIIRQPEILNSGADGPLNAPKPAAPKPEVRTGAFSTGSSARTTVDLPARQVQTGGFGDPNGVRGEGRPDKIANVASLGAFDLPTGPGAGNGTGGARGVRGVVASAGFGNGVAPVGNGNGKGGDGGSRAVRQGGFGDSQPPAAQQRRQPVAARETPVEILHKPKPDYTPEARSRKIEGEVLLRIAFGADGAVRVLEMVRGLGHGLDESARRAAQQIRFKPATRDGQPIDSVATVHIVFQMAY